MKVSIESEQFKRIASMISKVLASKGAGTPVSLKAEADQVEFSAGKDGRFLSVTCPAEVEESGEVITNNEWLASMRFRAKQVKFFTGKEGLSFSAGLLKGHFEAKTDAALIEENRPIKEIKKLSKLPAKLLRVALQSARIPSTDDTRCVKVVIKNNAFFLHTNDSYTGMFCKKSFDDAEAECEVIMPHRILEMVLDYVEGDTLKFGFSNGTMRFKAGDFDCYYPSSQSEVFNVNDTIKDVTSREKSQAAFTITVKDAIESLGDMMNLGKSALDDITISVTFDDKSNMVCSAKLPFGSVRHKVSITDAKISAKEKSVIKISANVFVGILQIIKAETAQINILESSVVIRSDDTRYIFPLTSQG